MFDPHVRTWVYDGFVPVVVPNEVRRGAVLAPGLDYYRGVLVDPDCLALEVEAVTYPCSHLLLQWLSRTS
jgi:hypothetical protein